MYAIMTVAGKDSTGIVAAVSTALAEHQVNILDMNQTLMNGYFTMILRVEIDESVISLTELQQKMIPVAEATGQEIRLQSEAIFTAMHEV